MPPEAGDGVWGPSIPATVGSGPLVDFSKMQVTSPSAAEKRLYRFDGFVVDPVRRLLTRDGEPVVVTPKSFSVLLILLERRGEVVEKEELIRRIWPDTFVTEANLTQNVSALRKALGERANDHRYVVTVPGRGYSFVADIFEAVVPEAESPAPSSRDDIPRIEPVAAPPPPRPGRPRREMLALILVLAALAVVIPLLLLRGTNPEPAAAARPEMGARPSLAVLGFKNLAESPGSQWLGTALAEMLTTELAVGGRVRVVTGENVARARQSPDLESLDPAALQRLHGILGCELLVVGSYLPLGPASGGQIRVDLHVLRLPSGETVTSLAQVGTEAELFELASQAGGGLRKALGFGELSPGQMQVARALQPSTAEAAKLYAEGLEMLRDYDTPEAVKRLGRAAEADPTSAAVRAHLAEAWQLLGHDNKAKDEARKAVALAASLPRRERLAIEAQAHAVSRQWDKAGEIYRSLWTFYPDDLEYGLPLFVSLHEAGRQQEALAALAALRRLPAPAGQDPRIDLQEARALRRMADLPGSLRVARAAAEKGRRNGENVLVAQALVLEGSVHLMEGRLDTAKRLFLDAQALYKKEGHTWGAANALTHVGLVLEKQGDLDGSERISHEVFGVAQQLGNVFGMAAELAGLGSLYQNRGDLRKARSYLERSRAQFAEIEDPLLEMRVLNSSAGILIKQGDLDDARRRIDEVLDFSRRIGSRVDEARARIHLGNVLSLRGDISQALRQQELAARTLRDSRDLAYAADALSSSAESLSRLGDLAAARKRCEEALAIKREAGDRVGVGLVLGSLALLEFRAGNLAASRERSEEQLRLAAETGSRSLRAWGLHSVGRVELAAGNLTEARSSLNAALAESSEVGEEVRTMMIRVDLARLALAQEEIGAAETIADASAAWWRDRRIPLGEARARAAQAEALLRLGRLPEAREAAARVRELAGNGEDRDLALVVAPDLARVEAAGGEVERALSALRKASGEAHRRGFIAAEMEARLASGEIALRGDRPEGKAALQALRKDAETRGYGRLVQRAEKVLTEAGRS